MLAYRRAHPRGAPFLALTSFSDAAKSVDGRIMARAGLQAPQHVHSTAGNLSSRRRIVLPAWRFRWLGGT